MQEARNGHLQAVDAAEHPREYLGAHQNEFLVRRAPPTLINPKATPFNFLFIESQIFQNLSYRSMHGLGIPDSLTPPIPERDGVQIGQLSNGNTVRFQMSLPVGENARYSFSRSF